MFKVHKQNRLSQSFQFKLTLHTWQFANQFAISHEKYETEKSSGSKTCAPRSSQLVTKNLKST